MATSEAKCCLAGDPGHRHRRSQTIGQNLAERAGVFVRPDTGHRPGDGRVFGGKRIAALEKRSMLIALIGAWPLRNLLEKVSHRSAVDGSFAAEKSGFLQVVVMGQVAEEKRSAAHADHRVHGVIGHLFAALELTCAESGTCFEIQLSLAIMAPVNPAKGANHFQSSLCRSSGAVQKAFWSWPKCFRKGEVKWFSGSSPGGSQARLSFWSVLSLQVLIFRGRGEQRRSVAPGTPEKMR